MANLTESPIYEPGIFQLEKTTPPLGGAPAFNGSNPSAGHANVQALQLANRTAWLKEQVDAGGSATTLASDLANNTDPTKGAAKVGWDGETVATVLSYNKTLSNYTTLRNYTGTASYVRVLAVGITGSFYYDPSDTTTPDDGAITIVGSDLRRWKRVFSGPVNVLWFGAKGDGTTDDTDSIQAAYDRLANTKIPLYFPSGRYLVRCDRGGRVTGDLRIFGDGMQNSIIVFDNYFTSVGSKPALYTDSAIPANSTFSLENMAIVGKWGDESDFSETNSLTSIFNFHTMIFKAVKLKGSRSGGIVGGNCQDVLVCDSFFEDMYRDSTRIANSKRTTVTRNFYKNILDDCVSVYSSDSNTLNIENSIIITDNNIIDSQGILAAGGKVVTIANNHILRPTHRAIYVGQIPTGFETGNTPVLSIKIHDNTIIDGFDGLVFSPLMGSGFKGIHIDGTPLIAKDTVETGNPVIDPRPYLYLNNTDDSGEPNAGGYDISVKGNTVTRTLGAVTTYSEYNLGDSRISRSGYVNPAISLAQLMITGVEINISGNTLEVEGNHIDGCITNLHISTGSAVNGVAMRNYRISGNILKDTRGYLVDIAGNGYVTISDNILDADPYHQHSGRSAAGNGSWDSTNYSTCRAINLSSGVFATIDRNTFKNTGVMVWQGGVVYTNITSRGNVAMCHPASTAMSTSNKGIGFITRASQLQIRYIILGSDPTDSSTFKKVISMPATSSSSVPTSGTYVAGHIVYADTSDGVLGWKRITTGSNHVLGTDWVAV